MNSIFCVGACLWLSLRMLLSITPPPTPHPPLSLWLSHLFSPALHGTCNGDNERDTLALTNTFSVWFPEATIPLLWLKGSFLLSVSMSCLCGHGSSLWLLLSSVPHPIFYRVGWVVVVGNQLRQGHLFTLCSPRLSCVQWKASGFIEGRDTGHLDTPYGLAIATDVGVAKWWWW